MLACIAGWVLTHRRLVGIERRHGTYIEPRSNGGDEDWWTYRSRTEGVASLGGVFYVRTSEYRSLAHARAELGGWEGSAGWQIQNMVVAPGEGRWLRWRGLNDFSLLGLGYYAGSRQGETSHSVFVPYWLLISAASGAWVWLWLPGYRRRRREEAGRCIGCGYSRAGLAQAEPCPECGMKPVTHGHV